jgi:hypothetical protein
MRANIESVLNAESDGTPVQLGFSQRNYFSREDHGIPLGIALRIGMPQDPNGWLAER